MGQKKVTISDLQKKMEDGKKITMMTAYDFPTASFVDQAGIDTILIGDSVGMVMLGYETTVPVTMDEMIHHSKAVTRGTKQSFIIGDMPFMSYQVSIEKAIENAARFIKEAGCDAVKLEGGSEMADVVNAIVDAGIPVCAHIGLTPQTATKLSGFKVQGKDAIVQFLVSPHDLRRTPQNGQPSNKKQGYEKKKRRVQKMVSKTWRRVTAYFVAA